MNLTGKEECKMGGLNSCSEDVCNSCLRVFLQWLTRMPSLARATFRPRARSPPNNSLWSGLEGLGNKEDGSAKAPYPDKESSTEHQIGGWPGHSSGGGPALCSWREGDFSFVRLRYSDYGKPVVRKKFLLCNSGYGRTNV